jgi:hypothetical protein
MIGTLPSCQMPAKKVQVLDQEVPAITAPSHDRKFFRPFGHAPNRSQPIGFVRKIRGMFAWRGATLEAQSAPPLSQRGALRAKPEQDRHGATLS